MKKIIIDGNSLTLDDLVNVARYNFPVEINKEALENVKVSRQIVDDIVEAELLVLGSFLMWPYLKRNVDNYKKI